MERLNRYRRQIGERIDSLVTRVEGLEEGTLRQKPAPGEWSAQEVLCHVAEANVFWINELKRVVQSPGPWGRGMDHEGRLKAVAQAGDRNPSKVIEEIGESGEWADTVLAGLREEDLDVEAPHRNPKFGTRPMSFLLDHFMVEHLDRHIRQIDRILGSLRERNTL
ncbi:DinB family protein [Melghirimyces profundicolus]|uniref:DinB family protein n=1 Tax=Melghirimyces profundicolus TaxID=1242148 RepID=A0A2T6C8K1_9BACL|nr:DinB family protein [Melghirimyces profundicolus]PTX64633.1 DinB family protein [Melghirimyces profundicolus]